MKILSGDTGDDGNRSSFSFASLGVLLTISIISSALIAAGSGVIGRANAAYPTIPVGANPAALVFDPFNGDLYVTNLNNNNVFVISGQTNAIVGSAIPVDHGPSAIAFDSANDDLYVTNFNDNTVSIISGQTNTVVGSPIPVGNVPWNIAFDSANDDLYVTNSNDGTVSVIATTMHSTSLTLNPIANIPSGATVTATGKLIDTTTNSPISGATITFTGTGAANLASVVTASDGTFKVTGKAPNTVSTGWTVLAHYGGGGIEASTNSLVYTYNTQ